MGQKKDANTLLLLHAEDFTDSSMYARPITNVGAEIVAGKFGNCFSFSSDQICYISIPETLNALSDFTVDFWVKFDILWSNKYIACIGSNSDSTSAIVTIYTSTDGNLYLHSGSNSSYVSLTVSGLATGTWYHIAFVRNGSNFYAFINGSLEDVSNNHPVSYTEPTMYSMIGDAYDLDHSFHMNGSIDEFRISNIARWTANFTPPTSPYTI